LASLLGAGARYAESTGRRLTIEWCLIGGVNDSPAQARRLRAIADDHAAHVNVIPMNRIAGSAWGPPAAAAASAFLRALGERHVTVRDTRGRDVEAACGQLRAQLDARRTQRPDGTLGPARSAAVG
jgi:23S rRNA (adenine2503-C2)-methyltransferase